MVGNSKELSDIPKVINMGAEPEHKPAMNISKAHILSYTSLPFKNQKVISIVMASGASSP